MNGRILRKQGFRGSVLEIDQSTRNQIARLGEEAQAIFAAQDQKRWTEAAGPDFLLKIVAGALVLKRVGLQTHAAIVLEDDGSHLAFMTCCALSMVGARLDRELLETLEESILLLAMCCPVEVKIRALPPLASLPRKVQANLDVQRQYANFRPMLNDRHDVTLADALILHGIFQQNDSARFQAARLKLSQTTEGLRTAIRRLRDGRKKE